MKAAAILIGSVLIAACDRAGDQNLSEGTELSPKPVAASDSGQGGTKEAVQPAAPASAEHQAPGPDAGACHTQDDGRIPANRIKAVGTEPFWAARIEGRCVTYMTPEDQQGTRIWTRLSGTVDSGAWAGALDGRRFELRTRPKPGCSDGMSDRRYPIAVVVIVRGEQRTGCAEPL